MPSRQSETATWTSPKISRAIGSLNDGAISQAILARGASRTAEEGAKEKPPVDFSAGGSRFPCRLVRLRKRDQLLNRGPLGFATDDRPASAEIATERLPGRRSWPFPVGASGFRASTISVCG